jgi:hypothetical protein
LSDELFDLSRLTDCERELWNKYCAQPDEHEGPAFRLWSFSYLCMLGYEGPPDVVTEKLDQLDPEIDSKIRAYLDNVRRARPRQDL